MSLCIHTCVYPCDFVCVYICICVCLCMCVFLLCVCVHVYVCIVCLWGVWVCVLSVWMCLCGSNARFTLVLQPGFLLFCFLELPANFFKRSGKSRHILPDSWILKGSSSDFYNSMAPKCLGNILDSNHNSKPTNSILQFLFHDSIFSNWLKGAGVTALW